MLLSIHLRNGNRSFHLEVFSCFREAKQDYFLEGGIIKEIGVQFY